MARSPEPPRYYAAAGAGYHRASPSSSVAASCVVAALFILLAAGGAAAALFLLYRPQAPAIAVTAVQLPSFASRNGTVAFTFQQLASVRNPNRSPLAHYDSSLRVAYAGGEVGSMYIPAGQIDGGRTQYMATSFTVPAFAVTTSSAAASTSSSPAQTITVPASGPSPAAVGVVALQQEQQPQQQQVVAPPVMEVDSLLVVKGKVTILRVFTHHVVAAKVCRIGVSPADGRVLGFRC
uniref:Late embryogenesis abundant protein LEA-2 subgroup domain-containing protein n=1 Tax=Oryza punctata TaxID=4537 RepID=A0A0E0L023_ORYPU